MAFETEVADLKAATLRLTQLRAVVLAVKKHCQDMLAEAETYVTQAADYRAIAERNGIPVTPPAPAPAPTPAPAPSTGTTYAVKGIVAEGDSITSGTQNGPNPWPLQLAALTGLPVLNLGQSSTTLNQMKDNYGGTDHAGTKFNANTYNSMIIGSAGTNDFTQDNVSLASLKSYIQTFVGKGKTTGYKVYVCTLTPRAVTGAYTSAHEAIRLQYNDWLRTTGPTFCDGIIDFAAVLTLSDMADGIHPSDDPGSKKMAAAVKAAITTSTGTTTGFKPDVVVFEGDSITQSGGEGSTGFPGKWKALSGNSAVTIKNIAREGSQCRDVDEEFYFSDYTNAEVGPGAVYVANKLNGLVFNVGTNDIANDNATINSILNHYSSICAKARAVGYKVWLTTILRRGDSGWNSSKEAIRTGVNDWVRNNWASIADGRIDLDSVAQNTTNFSDGIHPTETGNGLIANLIQAAFAGSTTSTAPAPAPSPTPAPAPAAGVSEITTNGVIDNAKWAAMAAKMSRNDGVAYRFGQPSPAVANKPTWFQPSNKPWPQNIVGNHSGEWQLGTFRTYDGYFQGGDFASNSLIVPYVADDPVARIGVAQLQSTSTDHGTFTQKPELPWVYYGRGLDAVETVYWKDVQGKTVQNPVCSANALGKPGWAVQPIICFQNGFVATAGFNTMTNKSSCQLPAGLVPTSVCVTSANEFALVTCWDVPNNRGVVAVISLCGLGHDATIANPYSGEPNGWWGEWNEPHPGLHNLGNLVFMKCIGVVPLPGMQAPTGISATTGHSRYGYLDGSPGEPSCGNQNFSNESLRQNWLPGRSLDRAVVKQGEAIIISRTERKAIFLNLKPLFDYINSMYFSADRNKYLQTTNIGQNAGQWPFTFTEQPSQMPTITKTITFDSDPTCVFVYPYTKKEEWRQGFIGTFDGKIRIYNLGGLSDTGNASAKVEAGSFNVGPNPTSITWVKEKARGTQTQIVAEHTRQLIFCVRGEAAIKWYDLVGTNSAKWLRTFQDTRIVDPVCVVDTDNHGGEHYVVNVADYSTGLVHGVRYGRMIMWTYPEQSAFDMGADGRDQFEYCGSFKVPGKPFGATTANVS